MSPTIPASPRSAFEVWLDRLAGPPFWWLISLEVLLLAAVNGLTFPLSVPFVREATGHVYLDFCAFCSSSTVFTELSALGPRGRELQLWLLPTIDVVIPVLSGLTGLAVLRRVTRTLPPPWRKLLLVPVAATLLDFVENAAIARTVWTYPDQNTPMASLVGILSGAKFIAYAAIGLCALWAASSHYSMRARPVLEWVSARPSPCKRGLPTRAFNRLAFKSSPSRPQLTARTGAIRRSAWFQPPKKGWCRT